MVPINKRRGASLARLQIVQRGSVIQLLGFFTDFEFGSCMNFVIKSTDRFEAFTKSEQHCLKIVDAKFALPKRPSEDNSDFICLDMPEYPGEHDDITIAFESEAGKDPPLLSPTLNVVNDNIERDRFASALPAAVNKPSRLGSFRR